jgi:DNA polymerase-3 subunit delta'
MNGSFLIFGGGQKPRMENCLKTLEKAKLDLSANNPDILLIEVLKDKSSIGIDQIREAIKFLSKKPFSHENKAIIILNAEKMTIEAQNSLLKTLEEPPLYALIVLLAKTQNSLLETIISRCRLIKVTEVGEGITKTSINEILDMTFGERLSWVEKNIKIERPEFVEILEIWLSELHERIVKQKSDQSFKDSIDVAENIGKILEVKEDIEKTNVNLRLAAEYLLLNLKHKES